MRPGDEFIQLFNELSNILQGKTGSPNDVSFSQILETVAEKSLTIHHSKNFLRSIGDLRNAIVHDRHYPEKIIADPRPEVIEELKKILEKIKSPTKVIPKFKRQIKVFSA